MFTAITKTTDSYFPTVLRIALGITILPHGLQKTLGWFGGGGVGGTIAFFDQAWGIPAALTLVVIVGESLGALALIAGFGGRIAAAWIAAIMVGGVVVEHAQHGLFMNWTGAQGGEGFEYHILAVAMAAVVAVMGSGRASVDARLTPAA